MHTKHATQAELIEHYADKIRSANDQLSALRQALGEIRFDVDVNDDSVINTSLEIAHMEKELRKATAQYKRLVS